MTALDLTNSCNTSSTQCLAVKGWTRIQCEHLAVYWRPMRCRRCMGCLLWKTRRVIAQVMVGLEEENKWTSFITLTSVPGSQWSTLMSQFSRLVKWLRSTYGSVDYAAVKQEGTSTGMKHLHVIFLGLRWVPYAILSAKWKRLTGAWAVDIQRVAGGKVAGYISRYIGQGMAVMLGKAVTFSKGWLRSGKPKLLEVAVDVGEPRTREWVGRTGSGTLIERWGPYGQCECPGRH